MMNTTAHDRWMRGMGFDRATEEEVAVVTPADRERAVWLIGNLVHYPNRQHSSYQQDVETVARALASQREEAEGDADKVTLDQMRETAQELGYPSVLEALEAAPRAKGKERK